jgi:hypothetical protein
MRFDVRRWQKNHDGLTFSLITTYIAAIRFRPLTVPSIGLTLAKRAALGNTPTISGVRFAVGPTVQSYAHSVAGPAPLDPSRLYPACWSKYRLQTGIGHHHRFTYPMRR